MSTDKDPHSSAAEPLQVMVGTAGHVDHGKTSLVKRLTGINTDRMKEEQARGMSIDFAVARLALPQDRVVGVIDVPGHEDFIRNMVAGASSIDVLMLIIAADDGVMPQTVEHMKIIKLLGFSELMVVVTKVDLVDPGLLEIVREDIALFLKEMGYPGAPCVFVSNETGEGVEDVRRVVDELVTKVSRVPDPRAFRMYVRSIFSIKGHGTVVTGVPCSGAAAPDESLQLMPSGRICTIRSIETFSHQANRVAANISSALNLRDVEGEELARGMALVKPGVYTNTQMIAACVRNESGSIRLKHRHNIRLHVGTAACPGTLRLFEQQFIDPGEQAFALVRLEKPLVLAAGDRIILRTLSPADTVGGGIVLSVSPGRLRRGDSEVNKRLEKAALAVKARDFFAAELHARASALIRRDELEQLTQRTGSPALDLVRAKEISGEVKRLSDSAWVVASRVSELQRQLERHLSVYHGANRLALGMRSSYAAELLKLDTASFTELEKELLKDQRIVNRSGHLALASFTPAVNVQEMRARETLLAQVTKAGIQTIARPVVREATGLTESELKTAAKLLLDEGLLKVVGGNFILSALVNDCRNKLLALFKETRIVELPAFREATGASRNTAVALLEFFDSEGLTKREGNGRILVRKM